MFAPAAPQLEGAQQPGRATSHEQTPPGGAQGNARALAPSKAPEGPAPAAGSLAGKPTQQKRKMADIFSMLLNTD